MFAPSSYLMRLFVVATSAIIAWVLIYLMFPLLAKSFLDQPNERSSHHRITPRGSGLAFVLVSSGASSMAWPFVDGSASTPLVLLPLVALPLALLGFLDDRCSVPVAWRYGAQFVTALVIVSISALASSVCALLPVLFVMVISVTALINFVNFMDGLDGLVAGCMLLSIGTVAVQLSSPWPIWALVGGLAGFLFWNWSPAQVFMGDVGSTFLGAVFAGLVLQASSWPEAFGCLLVATPLLADACLCVPRRLLAGQRVFQAHRLHLFQRLHQAGWSHARVSVTYIAATTVLAAALLTGGWPWVFVLAVVVLLVGVWLDQRLAVPFAVESKS